MSNTELWDRLGRTDPSHTKPFKRAGGFTGTAIKPMWSYRRMTEEFGPAGTGWGIGEPHFQIVNGSNSEVLVYCTVSVWYAAGNSQRTVFGVGGDKVVTHIKANDQFKRPERWENDDEAFKKAFTDAVTNALKLIGVGADVHMGMFDDNKYVNRVDSEFKAEKQASSDTSTQKTQQPTERNQPAQAPKPLNFDAMVSDLHRCQSPDDVNRWWKDEDVKAVRAKWPEEWALALKDECAKHGRSLKASDTVEDIKKQFGGTVVNEHVKEAAE